MFAGFPKNDAQVKHILRESEGHLKNTEANKELLISLSKDSHSYLGTDIFGVQWFAKKIGDKQLWVSVKNNIIQNGGMNDRPVEYIEGLGLKKKKLFRRKK